MFLRERSLIVASKSSLSKVSEISLIDYRESKLARLKKIGVVEQRTERDLLQVFNHQSLHPDIVLCRA